MRDAGTPSSTRFATRWQATADFPAPGPAITSCQQPGASRITSSCSRSQSGTRASVELTRYPLDVGRQYRPYDEGAHRGTYLCTACATRPISPLDALARAVERRAQGRYPGGLCGDVAVERTASAR